jgi:hypothetical protein
MRLLIAVVSCAAHLNRNTAVLETWGTDERVKVFTGKDLEVSDDYEQLPAKVKAVCEFALDNNFDFLFKCDSDTFIFLDRLLASGFEQYDYSGWTGGIAEVSEEYASGGAGYWLSRKAFEIVAKAPLTKETAEDKWVGRVLYDAGIIVHRDTRYGVPTRWGSHEPERNPFDDTDLLTWHPSPPKRMYELWNQVCVAKEK